MKVASEPEALLAVLKNPAYHFKRNAWRNKSEKPVKIAFVLIGAKKSWQAGRRLRGWGSSAEEEPHEVLQRSAQMQSKGADLLQPIPLSRPKSSRAILP